MHNLSENLYGIYKKERIASSSLLIPWIENKTAIIESENKKYGEVEGEI